MPKTKPIEKWTRFWRLVTLWETWYIIRPCWEKRIWEKCICDCWAIKMIARRDLTKDRWTRSCGCLQKEIVRNTNSSHRMTKTRIYYEYQRIVVRCTNPKEKCYYNYWGRGIKCLWESFEDFYRDMWESYEAHVKEFWEKNTTIERIDSNGNYCKENCTWGTLKEQANNKRNNTVVVINWEQHNLWEWANMLWISRETLKRHILKWKIRWEIFNKGTWKIYDYKDIRILKT